MTSSSCISRFSLRAVLAGTALVLASGFRPASATLVLTNGDFSNLTGLVQQSGDWYNGAPTGWSTANSTGAGSPTYSIYVGDGSQSVANLSQLGALTSGFNPLYQYLGTMDATGTVTVNFDVLNNWTPSNPITVGAALYSGTDPTGTLLNNGSFLSTGPQTLQATGVAAGTPITVAFWPAGGTPGLDSVIVVPEPSASSLLVPFSAGVVAFRVLRRRMAVA